MRVFVLVLADATSVGVLRNLAWARLALSAISTLLSAPKVIRQKVTPSMDVCKAICNFMTPSDNRRTSNTKFSDDQWTKRLHLFLFKVLDRAAGFQAVRFLCAFLKSANRKPRITRFVLMQKW